ncbi:MAG: hypothetical protein FWD73_09580 [Polyangiaceae bacterium]|nr:hypothetical protein [Polyangiaceae bacterium]
MAPPLLRRELRFDLLDGGQTALQLLWQLVAELKAVRAQAVAQLALRRLRRPPNLDQH